MASGTKRKGVVTGACGFMGSHMVEYLAAAGHQVVATDTDEAFGATDQVGRMRADVTRGLSDRLVPADITVPGALDEIVADADWVFHTAAVRGCLPWASLYRANVQGTARLIESIKRTGSGVKRLVLWSDGAIVDTADPGREPVAEDVAPDPTDDYQRSKWFQEFLTVERCGQEGIRWTVLRPDRVMGTRHSRWPAGLLRAVLHTGLVAIPSNLDGMFPSVCVEDVCGAALHLAKYHSGINGIFNVTVDTPVRIPEAGRILAKALGRPFVELPPFPLEGLRSVTDGVAAVENLLSRALGRTPYLEMNTLDLPGTGRALSGEKLKKAGYEFKHPHPASRIAELAGWYSERGLI